MDCITRLAPELLDIILKQVCDADLRNFRATSRQAANGALEEYAERFLKHRHRVATRFGIEELIGITSIPALRDRIQTVTIHRVTDYLSDLDACDRIVSSGESLLYRDIFPEYPASLPHSSDSPQSSGHPTPRPASSVSPRPSRTPTPNLDVHTRRKGQGRTSKELLRAWQRHEDELSAQRLALFETILGNLKLADNIPRIVIQPYSNEFNSAVGILPYGYRQLEEKYASMGLWALVKDIESTASENENANLISEASKRTLFPNQYLDLRVIGELSPDFLMETMEQIDGNHLFWPTIDRYLTSVEVHMQMSNLPGGWMSNMPHSLGAIRELALNFGGKDMGEITSERCRVLCNWLSNCRLNALHIKRGTFREYELIQILSTQMTTLSELSISTVAIRRTSDWHTFLYWTAENMRLSNFRLNNPRQGPVIVQSDDKRPFHYQGKANTRRALLFLAKEMRIGNLLTASETRMLVRPEAWDDYRHSERRLHVISNLRS